MADEELNGGDSKVRIAVLKERINNYIISNTEFQKEIRRTLAEGLNEFKEIKKVLAELPCDRRAAEHGLRIENLERFKEKAESAINRILVYIFVGIFSVGVTWGVISHTVQVNGKRIGVLEEIHPRTRS